MFGLGQKKQAAPDGIFITARLNSRVQPIARGDLFEDPLHDALQSQAVGEVTGGGTQLSDEGGVDFCDVEILVAAANDDTIGKIKTKLEDLGAPKGSKLIVENDGQEIPFGVNEGVAVFLNAVSLPDEVYEQADLGQIIEDIDNSLGDDGAFKDAWDGETESALYFYGPSFDAMKSKIEAYAPSAPLFTGCRIEQIA